MKKEKIEHVQVDEIKDIPYSRANTTDKKQKILPMVLFLLGLLKPVVLPFWGSAKFIKNDLYRSVKHDVKIAAFIAFASVVIMVLSIFLWITLGAGLIIYLVAGTGAVLSAWLYILLFEVGTIVFLAVGILLAKHFTKTPEAVERAKELIGSTKDSK